MGIKEKVTEIKDREFRKIAQQRAIRRREREQITQAEKRGEASFREFKTREKIKQAEGKVRKRQEAFAAKLKRAEEAPFRRVEERKQQRAAFKKRLGESRGADILRSLSGESAPKRKVMRVRKMKSSTRTKKRKKPKRRTVKKRKRQSLDEEFGILGI